MKQYISRLTYITHFKVIGRGIFPIDMLRYDQCAPYRTDDALAILDNNVSETREIQLLRYSPNKNSPTKERWQSFGWIVEEMNL